MHSLLRAACLHSLTALQSGILGECKAAGSLLAPPSGALQGNMGCVYCCGQLARADCGPPIGILGCFHCCGHPSRITSRPFKREVWVHSLLALGPSDRESWVQSLLRAPCPHPRRALQSGILGAFTAAGSLPTFGCIHWPGRGEQREGLGHTRSCLRERPPRPPPWAFYEN